MDGVQDLDSAELKKVTLLCPITGQKILKPVVLPGSEHAYERIAVEEKIRGLFKL